jgi:hypothetical protein
MVDRIAARYGRKLIECPIGFKYIADLMMEHEIVVGGEESGGIGYSRYLPERDGTLNCLLLANVMAEEGKPLGQLVADLHARVRAALLRTPRSAHYGRNEAKRGPARPFDQTTQLGRYSIKRKEALDGIKFFPSAEPRRFQNGNGKDPLGAVSIRVEPCCGSIPRRDSEPTDILWRRLLFDARLREPTAEYAEDTWNYWPSASRNSFSRIR